MRNTVGQNQDVSVSRGPTIDPVEWKRAASSTARRSVLPQPWSFHSFGVVSDAKRSGRPRMWSGGFDSRWEV